MTSVLKRVMATGVATAAIVAGMGALGATTASAAEAGDRLTGPLVYRSSPGGLNVSWLIDDGDKLSWDGYRGGAQNPTQADVDRALANAQIWELPALDTVGQIVGPTGRCITRTSEVAGATNALLMRECDPSNTKQQWLFAANGWLLTPDGVQRATDFGGAPGLPTSFYMEMVGPETWAGADFMNTALLSPVVKFTAEIRDVDHGDKSVVVGGKGEPGSTVTVQGPNGPLTTTIGDDGDWSLHIPGLVTGENHISVELEGGESIDLVVTIDAAAPTVEVRDVNHADKSALVGGKGEPGATITVNSPNGPLTTTVDENGEWSLQVIGLPVGDNQLSVEQSIDDNPAGSAEFSVIIDELTIPIANPLAAGALLLALGGTGLGVTLRRRKAAATMS